MFKKDDYIVTLKGKFGGNCAKENYCFKQRHNSKGIHPVIDLSGSRSNGHDVMSFDKKEWLEDWRYATPEEVAEYEKLGKPYDVSTLKSKAYDYEVVHCTTQEEWDFVRSKTTKIYSQDWKKAKESYPEELALKIDGTGWDGINFFKSLNSKIYSFKEWCEKFGYTMEKDKPMNTELTSLPEKWCIKDSLEVSKWAGTIFKCSSVFLPGQYLNVNQTKFPSITCYTFSALKQDYHIEITFDQFKKWVLKEEPMDNFEVGKWYKNLGHTRNRYGKLCGNVTKDNFPCKEYITEEGEYRNNGSSFTFFEKATLLEDLSEIQKYLPNGHPDKEVNLVGRYIKALVDGPNAGAVKKGEIGIITEAGDGIPRVANFPSQSGYSVSPLTYGGGKYELMSVGFNPNTTPKIPIDVSSTLHKSMEEIQEICKIKYPVGSVIRSTSDVQSTLLNDRYLYSIHGNEIWCHSGAGLLYNREDTREQWAEVIKLPESKIISKFDLKPGITYVGYWAKYEIIFQTLRGNLEDCYYISTSDDFRRGPCCTAEGHGINFRLATPEEEQKLLKFINPQKQESYEKQLDTPTTKPAQRNNYEITEPIISKQRKHKPKLIVAKLEEAIL